MERRADQTNRSCRGVLRCVGLASVRISALSGARRQFLTRPCLCRFSQSLLPLLFAVVDSALPFLSAFSAPSAVKGTSGVKKQPPPRLQGRRSIVAAARWGQSGSGLAAACEPSPTCQVVRHRQSYRLPAAEGNSFPYPVRGAATSAMPAPPAAAMPAASPAAATAPPASRTPPPG